MKPQGFPQSRIYLHYSMEPKRPQWGLRLFHILKGAEPALPCLRRGTPAGRGVRADLMPIFSPLWMLSKRTPLHCPFTPSVTAKAVPPPSRGRLETRANMMTICCSSTVSILRFPVSFFCGANRFPEIAFRQDRDAQFPRLAAVPPRERPAEIRRTFRFAWFPFSPLTGEEGTCVVAIDSVENETKPVYFLAVKNRRGK